VGIYPKPGGHAIYYCIDCQMIHNLPKEGEKIFLTGFKFIDGERILVGICSRKNVSKQEREQQDVFENL
jgi:hypothetical protein